MTTIPPYDPEPVRRWHDAEVRNRFAEAVAHQDRNTRRLEVPVIIDGAIHHTTETITSIDPGDPERIIATSAAADVPLADTAVETALSAFLTWSRVPATERAAVLIRAAAWLRDRRDEIAALEVFEAGKPWPEADADVCEAIDFCEYYAREAIRLAGGADVQSPLGEANAMTYQARGVAAVITPWNFPLAIPMGMVSSAIVTGNTVCFKPAEQTPAIAAKLVQAFVAAGLPAGVLSFVPGHGEVVGAHLVTHPDVATVSFTGSREVGLGINRSAAEGGPGHRHIKRVIAELGGKNPVVVDEDADLDEAVPAIAYSAFGFAGQKCSATSRLIVHTARYEELLERLVAHAELLEVGHPRNGAVTVGPVIDADAHQRLMTVVDNPGGRVRYRHEDIPDSGFFVPPTIVDDVPFDSPLWCDEQFGPILAVAAADDIDHAFSLANDTPYALTAGLFSRSPAVIDRAGELQAGNIYINRGTTGAIVGRQPFGGMLQSGMGGKAGGPDTLRLLCDAKVTTENTMRQGFAADLVTG